MTAPELTGPTGPLLPLDALLQRDAVQAVALAAAAIALALSLAPGDRDDLAMRFLYTLLLVEWVAAGTLFCLLGLRARAVRMPARTLAAVALGALLLNTWLVGTVAWSLGQELSPHVGALDAFLVRLTAIALSIGLLGLAAFRLHWQARRLALEAKQAELQALRARVQPHFLFNTLNTAVALVRAQPDKAEQVLLDLADLFRAALASPGDVPLADELDNVKRYLEIEALRLGSRLRLAWNVPPDVPDIDVPNLSLQPLAENAIRHGVEPSATGGELIVEVSEREGRVLIVIANSLSGATTHAGHRVGLPSSRERIEAAVSGAVFYAGAEDGRHVVRIELPSRIK